MKYRKKLSKVRIKSKHFEVVFKMAYLNIYVQKIKR